MEMVYNSITRQACINNKSKTYKNHIIYLLIGTYTSGSSEGIYIYKFNLLTGDSELVSSARVENPSYLTIVKNKYVYAVSENKDNTACTNAFSFDSSKGSLTLLNSEKTKGASPCYIAADNKNQFIATANYRGGSISLFSIQNDGSLSSVKQVIKFSGAGPDPNRQTQPHLHCVRFSPDGKHLFATDLGADIIYRFNIEDNDPVIEETTLKKFKVLGGAGPRHLEFHPSGKIAYLINELSGILTGFRYNKGELEEFQSVEADALYARGSADIAITPDGRYVYASSRLKNDGIAIFSIGKKGILEKNGYQCTGIHPRNLTISPNGKFLLVACKDSHTVEVYEIDHYTGLLKNAKKEILVHMPVCVKFISQVQQYG